jgi:PAS domain S-box-containing protein
MRSEQDIDTERRVLVVAPTRRDGEVTRDLLARAGLAVIVCADMAQLSKEIQIGAGAVLLTEEALIAEDIGRLVSCLKEQASWSDLPVVILMHGKRQLSDPNGLLHSLGNVTLLEKPAPLHTVVSALQTAVRARQRQYQIRDHIAASIRAERRSRELQEQLAIALEASELGTFHCVMPLGKIEWNAQCKAHFGLAPDADISFDLFYSLIHPADRERTRTAVEECVFGGKHYDIEYRVVPSDDSIRWIRATGRTFYDVAKNPICFDGTTEDITDRKRAEQRERGLLAETATANAKFRAFFEQGAIFAGIMDVDGTIVEPNRLSWEACGYKREEIVGKPFWECPWWNRSPELAQRIQFASMEAAAGQTFRGEMPYFVADGSQRTVDLTILPIRDEQGRVLFLAPTGTDITERKEAEAALLESRERFQAMANSIPQLAWMAKPDGSLFWYNQRWHSYCGTTLEEMEGWGWKEVHDPNDLPRVIEKWQAALASGEPWEDSFTLRRFDGEFRWHLSRAMPFRNESGQIQFWFGTNTDITEERDRAEARQKLLETEQAARAEAERVSYMKDEFLATLSHELRTPLSAIFGWTQLLKMGHDDPKLIDEGIEVIDRNVRLQTKLIEDLLDMSRIISGKVRLDVQQVDLAGLVNSAIESVKPAADAKLLRLERIVDPLAGPVSGDASRLQQVLWNLLTNAIKFTPKGGRVHVLLERVDSHVEISVADSGDGISREFLPHLFDRFSQADASTTRKHGGLGLGLSIVKNLVELHGGTIRAASPGDGLGATFIVRLPIRATKAAKEDIPRPRARASASAFNCHDKLSGVKVLVVDDEPDARVLVRKFLEECGATAALAASAAEAQTLVASFRPDVIISDIGMPGKDGYEFIRSVRSNGDRTPAVALTAFARAEDRIRSLQAGYQSHLPKPVEPAELVQVVASLAGRG